MLHRDDPVLPRFFPCVDDYDIVCKHTRIQYTVVMGRADGRRLYSGAVLDIDFAGSRIFFFSPSKQACETLDPPARLALSNVDKWALCRIGMRSADVSSDDSKH